MRPIIPTQNIGRRLPTLGRLRMGVKTRSKNGTEIPTSIETWRLTSHDEQALEQVAAIYGGQVKPWNEPKADPGQYELVTKSNELRVVLPPDPLGNSPQYERWSGGGIDRRCDGVTCARIVKGQDGAEQVEVPCLCVAEEAMACDPYTRLNVMIPEVQFGGVWMLATKGWDAAQELPGMVTLLEQMQGRGLTVGVLRLTHRRKIVAGQTRNFPVPVLALEQSLDALAAGEARYVAEVGAGGSAPALGPSTEGAREAEGDSAVVESSGSPVDGDDEIVDAEIVDDRTLADVIPDGITDAQALMAARNVFKRHGEEPPTDLAQVTEPRRVAEVYDELGVLEATP